MDESGTGGWPKRPFAAWCVRALIAGVPIGACIETGYVVSRLLPHPLGVPGHIVWLLAVLACSAVVFVAVQRAARRFLPLAMLLRLSLVFPDKEAPSRFGMALRAGSPRLLRAWALQESENGGPLDAGRQAEIVLSMVSALGVHDRKTRGHSERVQAFTGLMATELGLSTQAEQRLRWAALLHDIGKLAVPAEIINQPGRPDDEAMQIIRRHPLEGARIAEPLASWLGEWRHGIDQHHEKYNGTGYPFGLAGHEISLAGRIVSITDAFETMTAVRSYKKAMSVPAARAELVRDAGSHFDPEMVRSFLTISIRRLRWTAGAFAGLAELPLIGVLPRAGTAVLAIGALAIPGVLPAVPTQQPASAREQAANTASPQSPIVEPSPPAVTTAPPATTSPQPPADDSTTIAPEQLINQLLAPLGIQLAALPAVPTLPDTTLGHVLNP